MEIWRSVNDKYSVSNMGRIRSERRMRSNGNGLQLVPERILRQSTMKSGYKCVSLWENNKGRTLLVHRIVAKAFLSQYSEELTVNHIDGDKANNLLINLEMCTQKENIRHSYELGLSNNDHSKKVILNVQTGIYYLGAKEALQSHHKKLNTVYLSQMLRGHHPNTTPFVYAY